MKNNIFTFCFKDILKSNVIISDKSKKSYLQRLNDSLNSNESLRVRKDLPDTKGPFTIKLEVGENVFYGAAHSIQAARHDAASKAIDFLLENRDSLDMACLEEGNVSNFLMVLFSTCSQIS